MGFLQTAPQLDNTYRSDRVLRSWLRRHWPTDLLNQSDSDLDALGEHASAAWREHTTCPETKPILTQWDAWGARVDRIALTPAWRAGAGMATRYGLVATGHDTALGGHARSAQFARVYLYHLASEFYTCPLAMTDAAACAIKASGDAHLREHALPHFLASNVDQFWLSGQWMTETIGGSDVSHSETCARRGDDGQWRLYGRKWFTSAIVGEAAMTLARPEGAGDGSAGLALFFVETHTADGGWNGISSDRLKDKLGTRELPTAEIHLDGTLATLVGEPDHGVRRIAPMLNVTRCWNAVCAVAHMRRCIALARDFAQCREAFGKTLVAQPLHADTLADMQARFEAAFHLTFHVVALLGRSETGSASDADLSLLRLLTPLTKLWTGKLAVSIASETVECFGGNGYIEDTGIPQLLRDAQVYPIWEGTTNVLSLDALGVIRRGALQPLHAAIDDWLGDADANAAHAIRKSLADAEAWLERSKDDSDALQSGARRLALTLARCTAAALLAQHAAWATREDHDTLPSLALARFVRIDVAQTLDEPGDADALARDHAN